MNKHKNSDPEKNDPLIKWGEENTITNAILESYDIIPVDKDEFPQ